jgi:hypothetical protein
VADFVGPLDDPDRYELIELRSRGGEGELWHATIDVDGRAVPVAVKVLHTTHASERNQYATRWRQQAELLRTLEHPGLVTVREAFEGPVPHAPGEASAEVDAVYLVMNWAPGESLPAWVAQHPDRDVLDMSRIVTRMASAVDYLHSGKATGGVPVLHRDIKPANVVVDGQDVRVVDFGFARLAGEHFTFAGTPSYLAPEIVAGAPPTEASDRYGLGATAYYLFTGEDPVANDPTAMRARLLQVPGLEQREDITDHLLAMMARDPARRPSNIVEWGQTLAVGAVSERLPDMTTARVDDVTPSGRPKRRVVVGAVAAAIVLGVVAIAAVALGGGSGDSEDGAAATVTPRMPSLVGESLADARARLRKADIRDVTVEQEESSEPEGTVLDQDPAAGDKVTDGVTLTVAEEVTTLPDVVGKTLSDATNTLQSLGVDVTTTDLLDETKTDGTVVAQDPGAGGPLPDSVSLQVARQPVSIYLSDLEPVEGSASPSTATVSGTPYPHSVVTYVDEYDDEPVDVGYDLGRHYRRLKATVGLSDDSPSESQVRIEVFGDGRSLFSQTVGLGTAVPVDIDVTGVLRLTISATMLNTEYGCCDASIVWGDIRVLGTPSEVPGLGTSVTTTTRFG